MDLEYAATEYPHDSHRQCGPTGAGRCREGVTMRNDTSSVRPLRSPRWGEPPPWAASSPTPLKRTLDLQRAQPYPKPPLQGRSSCPQGTWCGCRPAAASASSRPRGARTSTSSEGRRWTARATLSSSPPTCSTLSAPAMRTRAATRLPAARRRAHRRGESRGVRTRHSRLRRVRPGSRAGRGFAGRPGAERQHPQPFRRRAGGLGRLLDERGHR